MFKKILQSRDAMRLHYMFSSNLTHLLPQTEASLGSLKKEHMEQIRLWRNEQIDILRQQTPLSEEDQTRYWEDTLFPATLQSNPPLLLFSLTESETFIGYGGLTNIDWNNKRAEISFLLDTKIKEESDHFQSLFSGCLSYFETVAFEKIGLEKLTAEVFAFRKSIIALLKKASFEKEGHLYRHIHKQGKVYDSLLFAKKKTRSSSRSLLVTSLSKKTPLIQSLRNAMGSLGEHFHIIGCDTDPKCLGQYNVDSFWLSPSWNDVGAKEKLIAFCLENGVVGIIPTRDKELSFFAELSSTLYSKNIALLSSTPKTIELCQDKWTFMQFCALNQIPGIPSYLTLKELPNTASSFVMKERYSISPKKLLFFKEKEEASALMPSLQHPIFQPKIEGIEYSIDVYRSKKTREVRSLVRRRNIIVDSEAYLTTPIRHQSLELEANKAAELLGIEGHAIFQALETPDKKIFFIECNPRVGGASTASFTNGLESLEWFLLEEILHQELPAFHNNLPLFPQLRIREDIALVTGSAVYK